MKYENKMKLAEEAFEQYERIFNFYKFSDLMTRCKIRTHVRVFYCAVGERLFATSTRRYVKSIMKMYLVKLEKQREEERDEFINFLDEMNNDKIHYTDEERVDMMLKLEIAEKRLLVPKKLFSNLRLV